VSVTSLKHGSVQCCRLNLSITPSQTSTHAQPHSRLGTDTSAQRLTNGPIIAGPFDTIEQAMTAFLVRDRTDQFDITGS
jgi:hypothetical protein